MNSRRMVLLSLAGACLVAAMEISSPAAWAQNEIKIGVVMPITGREAKPGQYQKEGIELAIKQINDSGGIMVKEYGKKLPVKLIVADDESDPGRFAKAAPPGVAVVARGGLHPVSRTLARRCAEPAMRSHW